MDLSLAISLMHKYIRHREDAINKTKVIKYHLVKHTDLCKDAETRIDQYESEIAQLKRAVVVLYEKQAE